MNFLFDGVNFIDGMIIYPYHTFDYHRAKDPVLPGVIKIGAFFKKSDMPGICQYSISVIKIPENRVKG